MCSTLLSTSSVLLINLSSCKIISNSIIIHNTALNNLTSQTATAAAHSRHASQVIEDVTRDRSRGQHPMIYNMIYNYHVNFKVNPRPYHVCTNVWSSPRVPTMTLLMLMTL